MEPFLEFLSFIALWLGVMVLIGIALAITQRFRKTDEEKPFLPKNMPKNLKKKWPSLHPKSQLKSFLETPMFCLMMK